MRLLWIFLFALSSLAAEAPGQDGRFNDEPSLVRAADGSVYVAWNGFRNGADALMVSRYQYAGGEFRALASWEAVTGSILNPTLVAGGDGAWLVYSAERGRNWDIYALPVTAAGPGKPVAVTADAPADVKPAAAWHNGVLWVAWESNREGARRVWLAGVRNGRAGRAEAVSAGPSDYGPSIVVESNGAIDVAWHGFRAHNYDVFLRRRTGSGEWGAERRLTTAPTMDRHAVLALHKDDLWVCYENSRFQGYRTGATVSRRVIAARVTPRGLEAPAGYRQSALYAGSETPSPAFDAGGRLWLAYLKPRLPRAGWEVWFTGHNGERWQAPRAVTSLKGMDRRPAIAIAGSTALLGVSDGRLPHHMDAQQAGTHRQRQEPHSALRCGPARCGARGVVDEARAACRARGGLRGWRVARCLRRGRRALRRSTTRAASCACCSATCTRTRKFPCATAAAT